MDTEYIGATWARDAGDPRLGILYERGDGVDRTGWFYFSTRFHNETGCGYHGYCMGYFYGTRDGDGTGIRNSW